jgi:transcriptional regulator with XRE-family HTH domain
MQHPLIDPPPTVATGERAFFQAFGQRLAQQRKTLGLTQVQLAEALGVSQQAITAYESGQRRVPISLLLLLAHTLGTTVEDLIGVPAARGAGQRGPAPKLQQQLERITRLPKAQQRFVMQMIDTVLQAASR